MADFEKRNRKSNGGILVSGSSSDVTTRVSSVNVSDPNVVQHKHEFSLLSAVGLAFAILNSWTAMAASLNLALPSGGPTAVIWGTVVSGIGDLCIAFSLAEICEFLYRRLCKSLNLIHLLMFSYLGYVFPTSGGQYHWAYALSPPKWAPLISWVNGMRVNCPGLPLNADTRHEGWFAVSGWWALTASGGSLAG